MPVRDVAPFVTSAVRSVLDCPDENLELIVIDDGSRDETVEKVVAAGGSDARLRILHKHREGIVPALNLGLAHSTGRFVARMDGDDWCDPVRFSAQRRFLESHEDVGVVGCQVAAEPEPKPGTGLFRYLQWQNSLCSHEAMFADRFVETVMTHATALFRRSVLMDVGGWRDPGWSEDLDLWLRLMGRGVRFAKVEQVWYHWRIRPEAATWSDDHYSPDAMLACKLHHLSIGPLAHAKEVVLWGVGRSLERWRRALEQQGLSVESVVVDRNRLARDGLPGPDGRVTVASYASAAFRDQIRARAVRVGWREGEDLFFVA